nr:hypothetical protein [Methylomarinum sp. Ch1-1]MDP4519897.1 hypothetical protein [Methylomarinum sp. Ch1-1]
MTKEQGQPEAQSDSELIEEVLEQTNNSAAEERVVEAGEAEQKGKQAEQPEATIDELRKQLAAAEKRPKKTGIN